MALGLLGYAVRSVVRNRRASASALVGLALGVAVATAPWIALDSSLRGIYDHYLEGIPYDASATGPHSTADAAAVSVAAIEGIERTEAITWFLASLNASASNVSGDPETVGVSFVDPTFASVRNRVGVTWAAGPVVGGALVHDSWREFGVDPGDTLVLERRVRVFDENYTVVREDVFSTNLRTGGYFETPESQPGYMLGNILASADDFERLFTDLNLSAGDVQGFVLVWLDRDALIDPFDPAGTTARLTRVETLAGIALGPLGYSFSGFGSEGGWGFIGIIGQVDRATLWFRLVFLALAVPALAMAALLAKVGFDVGLARRRRELAILRARGTTVRGVEFLLVVEAVLLALLAAAAGILLGIGLSRIFVVPIAGAPAAVAGYGVSAATVWFGVAVALLLAVGASHRVIGLVAAEDLIRALKAFHAEEVEIPYRASRDFLAAGVGAAGLILLLAYGSLDRSELSVIGFLLGFSASILAPLAPFFLAIGLARYLTRGTTRPYRGIARLIRRPLGELHILVDRNLARAPRRSSNTAMIVTFAVAFVLAVQTFAASADAYREDGVLRSAPSDFVVEATFHEGLFNASTRASLEAVPGVDAVTAVMPLSSNRGWAVFFESTMYLSTVPWLEARHLGGADPQDLMRTLGTGDRFAANDLFRTSYGLRIGDLIPFLVDLPAGEAWVNATLSAIVPSLPGLSSPFQWGSTVAYLDLSALGPGFDRSAVSSGAYLISLAPGTDGIAVARDVSDVFGGSLVVRSQAEVRKELAAEPMSTGVFGYLRSQGQLAVVLVVVAVGLLVYSAAAERRDELATLVARGAGPRAVARIVMAEGLVVSILGLLLGLMAGLVTAGAFLGLLSVLVPEGIPFVVPVDVLFPLPAVVLGVWLASYLGALAIQRMDVPRVLKLRGG